MAAPVQANPREELWIASFDTYYDCFFEELIADDLITFWSRLDGVTKVLVAVTASGSAISGWAFWNQHTGKLLWGILSGAAAVLSLIDTKLNIPTRIKAHTEDKRRFAGLRTELETFRYSMKIQRDTFDVNSYTKEFLKYRSRYSHSVSEVGNDIARTRRREVKVQNKELNVRLKNDLTESEDMHT